MLCGGSIGLQADTVTLASGMPLEFPAPPSLQILAIARYRCGLRLVWHENPSLLYVPSRMKHYTRSGSWTGASVRFFGFLARRDDAADCILQGEGCSTGAPKTPESRKSVQSCL